VTARRRAPAQARLGVVELRRDLEPGHAHRAARGAQVRLPLRQGGGAIVLSASRRMIVMIVISSSHPISSSSHHLTTASARARTLPTSSARAAATRATQARAPTRCSSPPATSRCRPAPPPAAPCAVGLSDSPASPPPTLFTGHRRTAQLGAEFETVRDKFMDAPQPGTSSTHALGKVRAALSGCSSDAVCSAGKFAPRAHCSWARCVGKFAPRADGDADDGTGCVLPLGAVEKTAVKKSSVNVNEFVVYDVDQVPAPPPSHRPSSHHHHSHHHLVISSRHLISSRRWRRHASTAHPNSLSRCATASARCAYGTCSSLRPARPTSERGESRERPEASRGEWRRAEARPRRRPGPAGRAQPAALRRVFMQRGTDT
jgi:hypothetical protein